MLRLASAKWAIKMTVILMEEYYPFVPINEAANLSSSVQIYRRLRRKTDKKIISIMRTIVPPVARLR